MTPFFRFPNTPHIRWLAGGSARGDKILSEPEVADLLSGEVTVEEKVDGANIGVSLDDAGRLRAQNRGQFLEEPFRGQFSRLPAWLTEHVLGLAPATPGFGRIRVEPHLGDLEWAEGTLPTPHGVLKVRHEKRPGGRIKTEIDGPKAVRERVREMDFALLQRAEEQDAATEQEPEVPLIDRLHEISCPVLIVTGALDMPDALASAMVLEARIPGAGTHVFPNAAHLPSMEEPRGFTTVVREFLQQV